MTETDRLSNPGTRVPTRTLPEGALFVADDGTIYQVVLAGSAGFRKARRWGGSDREAVALVPKSPLSFHYPVVAHGIPLPHLSRADLTGPQGETYHYHFVQENQAKTAAHLDEALAWQSGSMARQQDDRWVLTDGMHLFRVYHYEASEEGQRFDLPARFESENIDAVPYREGPDYWSYVVAETGAPEPASVEETKSIGAGEAFSMQDSDTVTLPAALSGPTHTSERKKEEKMILAVDIGYGYTKGVGPDGLRFSFPSVVGNAEEIAFSSELLSDQSEPLVQYSGRRFFYGDQALLQSRVRTAIFDRSRVRDEVYRLLFVSALAEVARRHPDGVELRVVTGLPVGFFSDRNDVLISLEGEYQLQLEEAVTFEVEKVFVVPQPFGSLFRELLNEEGKISNVNIEQGRVAVIDIGTYTTDFIVSDELRYVQRLSSSIPTGWSEALTNLQQELSRRYRLDLTLHEVDRAVRRGQVRVKGEPISIDPLLMPAVRELEAGIAAKARDLWGEGADLDMILVTGGAAEHLAGTIQVVYPQARLAQDSFWANAEGFYRFGQRPATFGED